MVFKAQTIASLLEMYKHRSAKLKTVLKKTSENFMYIKYSSMVSDNILHVRVSCVLTQHVLSS